MHLLFVCTGNICRSPTAERLAAAHASRLQIPSFRSSSAGTRAVVGSPIHRDAALVLTGLGGEAAGFAARQFSPKIAADVDLILTMTKAHRDRVLELAPRLLRRTFTMAEMFCLSSVFDPMSVADLAALRPQLASDKIDDILDPIGQSPEVFAAVGSEIADMLPPIIEFCRRSAVLAAD